MCAMFKEVQSNCAKNSISAGDSSLAETPIKAWEILSRRCRLWTPVVTSDIIHCLVTLKSTRGSASCSHVFYTLVGRATRHTVVMSVCLVCHNDFSLLAKN